MVFGKLRDMFPKKKEPQSDEYMELGENTSPDGKVGVRIETLADYNDTDRIQQMVREGNVVFLRIRDLRAKDIAELKRAVDKLRKTCTAMNGDMVGVDEDFLVITPQYAQIYRGRTG
jgi:SepF-like predicted cell division protein (DUF552 family)